MQGGVVPLSAQVHLELHARSRASTRRPDEVFVVGLKGWQTNAANLTGFDRVRYTGNPVRMLTQRPDGLKDGMLLDLHV